MFYILHFLYMECVMVLKRFAMNGRRGKYVYSFMNLQVTAPTLDASCSSCLFPEEQLQGLSVISWQLSRFFPSVIKRLLRCDGD